MMLVLINSFSFAGKYGLLLCDNKCMMVVFKLKQMISINEPLIKYIREYFAIEEYRIIDDNRNPSGERLVNQMVSKAIPLSQIKGALTEEGSECALEI